MPATSIHLVLTPEQGRTLLGVVERAHKRRMSRVASTARSYNPLDDYRAREISTLKELVWNALIEADQAPQRRS